jgi:S-adenosylmethionine synthetase
MENFLFTSEQISDGHPDKLCDYVSDSILDACLAQDPNARVAVETLAKSNTIVVAGELTFSGEIDVDQIVRNAVKEIGYEDASTGMDYKTCNVINYISKQSSEIANAVHEKKSPEEFGAGDQGLMIGYATDETEEAMPMSYVLSTRIIQELHKARVNGDIPWLMPDMKSQVTLEYQIQKDKSLKPVHAHTVLVSVQHKKDVTLETIKETVQKKIFDKVIPSDLVNEKTRYFINPSGSFIYGGPFSDAGLTGRKIIADTYGGWGGHGGGAFSGKDSTKVDRSGAYAARMIAKNLVKNNLCKRCKVQVAYGIGVVEPISLFVDSYGTVVSGKTDKDLMEIVQKNFDLRPGMLIQELGLDKPIFKSTTLFGHFMPKEGGELPWEKVKELK